MTGERLLGIARRVYGKVGGRAWAPPDPGHPLVEALVDAGYVRHVDGICVTERVRDACLAWTEAGHAACRA